MGDEESKKDLKGLKFNPFASSFVPSAAAAEFIPGVAPQVVTTTGSVPAQSAPPPKPATPTPQNLKSTQKTASSVTASPSSIDKKDATKSSTATIEKTAAAVEELSLEDKEAEEEFYQDAKQHLNIIFIGHVDAGKSTMGGHMLYLTGMVDKRTLEKFERDAKEQGRESWYLSWALDTNAEERAKGKTVEVGRAYFETPTRRFTILDAPGHKAYIPNMISGAAQADVAILVISARKGEFETGFERGGQTREHAMLVKTSGIKHLIVVINKMDDHTVNWSKERYDECCDKLLPFLKQCGYNPKSDLDFMPISGFTGANLKDRIDPSVCSWYSGPSLLEFLESLNTIDRKAAGAFMMPISEKYREMGTIVHGKIESGRTRKSKEVLVMPNRKLVEVLAVYGEQEEEIKSATAGDNIRLRLKGVEEEEISVGFVLCDPAKPIKTTTAFEAQLMILEHKNILCAGYSCILHIHTCVEEVTIGALLQLVDKKTGRKSKKPPMFVKKGQIVIVRVELNEPICVETYNDYPQLGRFTLRDEGKTIAMGKVTKLLESANAESAPVPQQ